MCREKWSVMDVQIWPNRYAEVASEICVEVANHAFPKVANMSFAELTKRLVQMWPASQVQR